MAATAQDWAKVSDVKEDLRLPADDTTQDHLIARHIDAAAAWIAGTISKPLVVRQRIAYTARPSAGSPLRMNAEAFRSVVQIAFWSPTDDPAADPASRVAGLGAADAYDGMLAVWPPGDGWPETHPDRPDFRVTVEEGLDETDPQNAGLKQAIVLLSGKFYDGDRIVSEESAVYALLDPYRAMRGA